MAAAVPPSLVLSGGMADLLSPRPPPTPRLSYQQELWGGLELAEKRVEEGRKTYREVQSFLEEMIDLELSYVKGFKKLSARQSMCTEGGTLGSAWQAFRKYLHINADMHALLMEHWKKASFALQDHCAQQTKATTSYFAEATKLNKEREKGLADVMRLKSRYYKVAREAELAKQQYEGAQSDSSIATTKLVKLNATLQALLKECETSEKLYAKAVEEFNAAQEVHVQETKKILTVLEAMEESRIVTMKSIFEEGCMTWGGSFTHQPEALGAVQKIIKNIDSQKDIQNWILSNRTGQGLPAPLAVEPWQPASKFRRDRSASGNSVRFKFKPEGVGTVIVSTTSGVVPTANSPPIKRQREEAKKNEAEKEKAAERDDSAERPALPRVRALYQYEAEEEDELSINSGDIITVLEIEGEGWWKGEINGRVGSFPSNYVRPLSASSDSFSAIATKDDSDFCSDGSQADRGKPPQQSQPRDIPSSSRSLGDFRTSADFASPPLSPSSSYTALSSSSPSLLTFIEQQKQQPHSPNPGSSPMRGSEGKRGGKLTRTGGLRRIVKDDETNDDEGRTDSSGNGDITLEQPRLGLLPAPVPVPDPASIIVRESQVHLPSPHQAPPEEADEVDEDSGFECVVLFDFEAENEDELTIRAGEMLRVTEEVEQWFVGVFPDGRTGMFPSNYVRRTDGN